MSVTDDLRTGASPPDHPPPDSPAGGEGDTPPRAAAHELSAGAHVVSAAVTIVAALLLGFVAWIAFASGLHHARAQHTAYANFRAELALGTAPTGPTTPNDPSTLLAPGSAMAVLRIPATHLNEVVFEGTTGAILQKGPGHLRDTPFPGQAGTSEILGRAASYGGPFGTLSQLQPGQAFTVTTGQGVARYRVLDVRRAGDPIPPPPAAGKGRLILVTADGSPYWPSGILRVDADLVSPTQPTPTMVLSASDLAPAERAMGTDPSAWYPLVLWGQALLLAAIALTWMRLRWGGWQVWIVAVPVLGFLGLAVADQVSRLLPNLM